MQVCFLCSKTRISSIWEKLQKIVATILFYSRNLFEPLTLWVHASRCQISSCMNSLRFERKWLSDAFSVSSLTHFLVFYKLILCFPCREICSHLMFTHFCNVLRDWRSNLNCHFNPTSYNLVLTFSIGVCINEYSNIVG